MSNNKPRITAFVWHDQLMAIDWEDMQTAFDISVQHGDAGIFIPPPPDSSYSVGVQAAISAQNISHFELQLDPETGLTEVVLNVTYESGKKSLGLTNQLKEARRWVADANEIVRRVREERRHE